MNFITLRTFNFFMPTLDVKQILLNPKTHLDQKLTVSGWVRTCRVSKNVGFIELSDGTSFTGLQIVFNENLTNFAEIEKITIASSLEVKGKLVASPGGKQAFELAAEEIKIIHLAEADYPLQKKRHSFEFLRTIAHLRPRGNTFAAVFRVRSLLSFALQQFFQEQNFVCVHAPIITTSDAEGAGEMFRVTTLDLEKLPTKDGKVDFSQDFFSEPTNLTVSGQLSAEAFALAFKKVYSFGPTFRAENSNTKRHLAEFWMLEPEIAFASLVDDIDLAEAMLKYVIKYVLDHAPEEMKFFDQFIEPGLIERLQKLIAQPFARITYTEAMEKLKASGQKFELPLEWGMDLQTEHERYLSEKIYQSAVFVTDYPKEVKAFYMRQNDDGKTVAAVDLLVPGVGEIIGGSQREERLEKLTERMKEMKLKPEDYAWYLQLRQYGSVPHAGFGLGFERLVMYVTGMENARDVIAFPRTPGSAEF